MFFRYLTTILSILVLATFGCQTERTATTRFDPCDSLRQLDPHCGWKPHWNDSGISVNAIDGTKTQFLSLESSSADNVFAGHLQYAELRLCFENGKICGNRTIGVGVDVNGSLESVSYDQDHSTAVRVRFDQEKPTREIWGISDSGDVLFPSGRQQQFISKLLAHKKMILEFSYFQRAPRAITFELSGLKEAIQSAGLQFAPSQSSKRSNAAIQSDGPALQSNVIDLRKR